MDGYLAFPDQLAGYSQSKQQLGDQAPRLPVEDCFVITNALPRQPDLA